MEQKYSHSCHLSLWSGASVSVFNLKAQEILLETCLPSSTLPTLSSLKSKHMSFPNLFFTWRVMVATKTVWNPLDERKWRRSVCKVWFHKRPRNDQESPAVASQSFFSHREVIVSTCRRFPPLLQMQRHIGKATDCFLIAILHLKATCSVFKAPISKLWQCDWNPSIIYNAAHCCAEVGASTSSRRGDPCFMEYRGLIQ